MPQLECVCARECVHRNRPLRAYLSRGGAFFFFFFFLSPSYFHYFLINASIAFLELVLHISHVTPPERTVKWTIYIMNTVVVL